MRFRALLIGDVLAQFKYGFYFIYLLFTIIYISLLYAFPPEWRQPAAILMIYSDPAAMGLYFMGAIILFEKSERVLDSIAISPVKPFEYVVSKLCSIGFISTIAAISIGYFSNTVVRPVLFIAGVFLCSCLISAVGLIVACKISSLNQFIIATIPAELLINIPAIVWIFGYEKSWLLYHPGVCLIELCRGSQKAMPALIILTIWTLFFSLLAERTVRKMLNDGVSSGSQSLTDAYGFGFQQMNCQNPKSFVQRFECRASISRQLIAHGDSNRTSRFEIRRRYEAVKPLFRSFGMFLRQISGDSMLYAVCIAPLLAACFFRFGVPYLETLLCAWLGAPSVLAGYYPLIDLFLAVLTPFLFCFASSMVILTEYDENMTGYLAVTPVGRKGYLTSRFAFPALLSFFVSMVLVSLFSLTAWTFFNLSAVCILAAVLSIATSLLVVSLSRNRVEGMAVAKLSGIMLFGLAVPFFLYSEIQYLFSALPSFWIAKLCLSGNALYLVPALLTSLLWILFLYRRFERKLS